MLFFFLLNCTKSLIYFYSIYYIGVITITEQTEEQLEEQGFSEELIEWFFTPQNDEEISKGKKNHEDRKKAMRKYSKKRRGNNAENSEESITSSKETNK